MNLFFIRRWASILAVFVMAVQFAILPVHAVGEDNDSNWPKLTVTPMATEALKMEPGIVIEKDREWLKKNWEWSAPVTPSNVVDVLSTDVERAPEAAGSGLANVAADKVFEKWEGKKGEAVVDDVKNVDKEIEEKIMALGKEWEAAGDKQELKDKIMKKIAHFKELRAMLRGKAIKEFKEVRTELVQPTVAVAPKLYEVRWGELNESIRRCKAENTETAAGLAEKCKPEPITYEGKIGVDSGTFAVRKPLLFEENDKVTQEKGSAIAFQSVIAGHWDGLMVEYAPDASGEAGKPVNVTVSIGELSITKPGAEIFGRYKIGNGHEIEIRPAFKALPGVTEDGREKMMERKLEMSGKLEIMHEKVRTIRESPVSAGSTTTVNALEEVTNEIGEYNFEDETAAEMEEAVQDAAEEVDEGATEEELRAKIKALQEKLKEMKQKARMKKFEQKLIPFRDTDDNEWYTSYVSNVKNKGIISGYKDAAGNELGEFRPANNITVAEILKIGLETADKGQDTSADPALASGRSHWAKGYVKKAEDLDLTLIGQDTDLNRPATRGEVVRMMLEALGIRPEPITTVEFSDVSASDPNAAYIEYAKDLDIVSGDAGKTTFRPNDPVNRAEAAKITNQIMQILMGGE